MKALFSTSGRISISRVLREYRTALVPLVVVLAVNVVLLAVVVLPLSRRVSGNEQRARAAEAAQAAADKEFKQAEALRDGKARATTDLETFYKQVLPADVSAARRITQLKSQQIARQHSVTYERSGTTEEDLRDSTLDRLTMSMMLSGDYDDIRSFIYELETAADFVVIDNLVLAEGIDTNAPLSVSLELSTYYRTPLARHVRVGSNAR